jgi:hypothetical protein
MVYRIHKSILNESKVDSLMSTVSRRRRRRRRSEDDLKSVTAEFLCYADR